MTTQPLTTLTIFYDPHCGLCLKFRGWLEGQAKRVAVKFVAFDSAEALALFPGLLEQGADREIVVLADDGRWWQGSAAWLTCLWTTVDHREWSYRLAAPIFQPFVKKAVHLLSENRLAISRLMNLRNDMELARSINALAAPKCPRGTCAGKLSVEG